MRVLRAGNHFVVIRRVTDIPLKNKKKYAAIRRKSREHILIS